MSSYGQEFVMSMTCNYFVKCCPIMAIGSVIRKLSKSRGRTIIKTRNVVEGRKKRV